MVKKITAITAAILLMAGSAMADIVTLDFENVSPSASITYSDGTFPTGYHNFNITTPGAYYGNYQGFCVDPASLTYDPAAYDVRPVSGFGVNYQRAAWLLGQSNASNAILTQVAIWELMFDPSPGDVYGGAYKVVTAGYGAAQTLVDAAFAVQLAAFDMTGYFVAVSPVDGQSFGKEKQDFIFRTPEPGTLLLMGLGLIGLAGLRRKE
jgi:hypothetical protein